MLNNTFEAGMSMKTKERKTQCPKKIRLLGLNFRHLRRTDTHFAGNCCFWTTVCRINSAFRGFLPAPCRPFAKDEPCYLPRRAKTEGKRLIVYESRRLTPPSMVGNSGLYWGMAVYPQCERLIAGGGGFQSVAAFGLRARCLRRDDARSCHALKGFRDTLG